MANRLTNKLWSMLKKIQESAEFLSQKINFKPTTGIILGTGLGGLVNEIQVDKSINYDEVPHLPRSTVKGHQGKFFFGKLGEKEVIAMQGRLHYYEGYTMPEITFPIRVMKLLGIKTLIISNASGGINPEFEIGDIMFISDHINLMPNPLIGKNLDELGPRFLDMSDTYDKKILSEVSKIAASQNIRFHTGTYAAVTGPTFETPAEYKYIGILGADAVGMSTIPEVIVAKHSGMKVFALSVITDLGVQGKIVEITHDDVIDAAQLVEPKLTKIIVKLLCKKIF